MGVSLDRPNTDPLRVVGDMYVVLQQLTNLVSKLVDAKQHAPHEYRTYYDMLISEATALMTTGGVVAAETIVAMTALISVDPTRMVRVPKQRDAAGYHVGPWGDWERLDDNEIGPWRTSIVSFILTIRIVWPRINPNPLPDEVSIISGKVQVEQKKDIGGTDKGHSMRGDGAPDPDGGLQGATAISTDPQPQPSDNSDPQQTQSPQTTAPSVTAPSTGGTPVNVPNTPSYPVRNVLGVTNVQPAQQRFIGGNVPTPLGGSSQTGGGLGFVYGLDPGDGGYYGKGKKSGTPDGDTGGAGPAHSGGGGGPLRQSGIDDPPSGGGDIWQLDGPGETSRNSDNTTDANRERYADDTSKSSDSSSGSSADTGVSGTSRDDVAGPPDRNWTSGHSLGGFGWDPNTNRGDPNPDDDGGGSESKPTIPYGPHHQRAMPAIPVSVGASDTMRRQILERMMLLGLLPGPGGGGDDWGGTNPHYNPDPDSGGGGDMPAGSFEVSGEGIGVGAGMDGLAGDSAHVAGNEPSGPDPDNEWGAGGYNPHYQPWSGYVWTPYSRGAAAGTTRAAPVLPARVQRAAALRFK